MSILLGLVILLILITLYKPAYGVMVYMIIRLCIPPSARIFNFSFNTLALAILIILIVVFHYPSLLHLGRIQKRYIKIIVTYILSIFALAIISSITAIVPLDYQLSSLSQYTYTELLPSIVVMLIIVKIRDFKLLNYVILFCACFSACYAIFTFFSHSNPLVTIFAPTTNEMVMNAELSRRGMLEGTGVGLMNNKISMSLIAMLFFIYFWGKNFINRHLINIVLVLSFIAVVLTSQRTAILCTLLFLAYVVIKEKKNTKRIFMFSAAIGIVVILASLYFKQFEQLKNVFMSVAYFWSDDMQSRLGIGGSTMDLRLRQFISVIEITGMHIVEGLGYDFHHYFYFEKGGMNSIVYSNLAGFESIILSTLASSGVIGLFALFRMYYKNTALLISINRHRDYSYEIAFVITFLIAAIMTNYSGSSFLFFIFLVLNIKFRIYQKKMLAK